MAEAALNDLGDLPHWNLNDLYPAPIRKLRVCQTGRDNVRRWSIGELKLWKLK